MLHTKPIASILCLGLGLAAAPARAAQQAAAGPDAAAGAVATAEALPRGPATMLHLRGGDVLWGFVEEHGPEALAFRRLETGGLVRLSWGRLDARQRDELRERWGYAEHEADEVLIEADRLPLADGTELVGAIVGRSEDYLYVKTARSLLTLPKLQIAGVPSRVQVPALDLYTREELYQKKLAELRGGEAVAGARGAAPGPESEAAPGAAGVPFALRTPEANWELAEYCTRILDYVHAHEHLRAVEALDPAFRGEELAAALRRTGAKAAVQVQADELGEIDLMRARKRYDDALVGVLAFRTRYPGSPLAEDLVRLEKRILRSQERDLREAVVRSMHAASSRVARETARELGYQDALAYVESSMQRDVVERVIESVRGLSRDVTAADVMRLWSEREGGRYHRASYGQGTWLLGEDRALAGLPEKTEEPAARDSRDPERRAQEEKIRRYLENQKLALKARKADREGEDPEAFWKDWSSSQRALWLLAWFVESSGQFEIRDVRFQDCRECGGTGVRETLRLSANPGDTTSSGRLYPCPACRHIGKVRRISYR